MDTTGLAYCEVCRTVIFCPSQITNTHLEKVKQTRMLLAGQSFAYCPICKKTQVFTHLDPKED